MGRSPRSACQEIDMIVVASKAPVGSAGEESPRNRKSARSQRLYQDAVDRRQRQQVLKDEAERVKRNSLEEFKRDTLLKQRERQRFYRFRDTRTHEEREEALLKRRQERTEMQAEQKRDEEEREYSRCTFQPKSFTKDKKASGGARSSSCGATVSQASKENRERGQKQLDSPRKAPASPSTRLRKLLRQQQSLIVKFSEIDADMETLRSKHKDGRMSQADQRQMDVELYKRNLEIVHAMDRLDMEALELPQAQLDSLLTMGYRLGIGEKGRRGITSPRQSSRQSLVDTPRNNLRCSVGEQVDIQEGSIAL